MLCPNCYREIDDDSRFCRFCGVEFVVEIIPEDENENINSRSSSASKKKRISSFFHSFSVLGSIILAVVIIGSCVLLAVEIDKIGKEVVTDAVGEEIREGRGSADMSVKDVDGTVRQIETDRTLLTAQSILSEYTEVMNQLKNDSVEFSKIRYQNLPSEYQNLGGVGKLVLPIIEKYVTSKSVATKQTYSVGNVDKLPVVNSAYGCLLTDATKIKNAYCEVIDDDVYKIVITVEDELNPEIIPAGSTGTTSAISGIFDPYDAAEQINAISSIVVSDIDFNYTDCTVTLVYNHKTKEVQSLNQTLNIDITANVHITQIKARITDITEYSEFIYQ